MKPAGLYWRIKQPENFLLTVTSARRKSESGAALKCKQLTGVESMGTATDSIFPFTSCLVKTQYLQII